MEWLGNASVGIRQIVHTSHSEICMKHSVMAETTVKQCAFAFIMFDIQHWDIGRSKHMANRYTPRAGRLWSPGGEVGTAAFRLFPWPNLSHETECSGGAGERTNVCRFTRVPTWVIAGTDLCMRDTLPCLQSPAMVFVLLTMLSGGIFLRLKPYVFVKISFDIVTEHCCQVCVPSMRFCRPDCRLCADMASW